MSDKSDSLHVSQDGNDRHEGLCDKPLCTSDKILTVAIDLISDKGYKTVTTKEIALEAGVSEMTLFRHFGCKLNILQDAIIKFSCSAPLKQLFEERLVQDLEVDLLEISRAYRELMNRNKKIMIISLKEGNNIPVLKDYLSIHTQKLKVGLINYFSLMQELGKVIKVEPDMLALSFLNMNLGAFMDNIIGDDATTNQTEKHIESGVKIFARGLTP